MPTTQRKLPRLQRLTAPRRHRAGFSPLVAFTTLLFTAAAIGMSLTVTPVAASEPAHFRVVGVKGTNSLKLRAAPSVRATVVRHIPFNARGLRNRREARGNWRRVSYRGASGWVSAHYLYEDQPGEPVYYASGITTAGRGAPVRAMPWARSRLLGSLQPNETAIEARTWCTRAWCAITFQGRRGFVERRYIVSWRP